MAHAKPALHNAMWPGLVGKGGPDAEPPIDLDTMLDLTAKAEVGRHEVRRRRSVPVRSARQHRLDQRRPQAARRQGPREGSGGRIAGRAGVAADRRRIGDGQRRRAEGVPDAGAQGLRDRPQAAKTSASAATASSASTRPRSPAEWAKDPAGNTKKIAETFQKAADIAESTGERLARKGKSAGAACTACKRNVELLEMVDRPKTVGFQADMAHTLLFTMGYNAPEDRLLPEGFDWSDQADARRGVEEDDATRCGRGRSISTSRRTTARSRARARTTRPAATACPSIPTASSTSSGTPATGCATTRAQVEGKLRHICWDGCMFPNAVMNAAANLERRARRHGGGPRRARLGLTAR